MIGKVKFFDRAKRFGFIIPEGKSYRDKVDVFFYEDKILGKAPSSIEEDAEVEYELIPYSDRKALSVRFTGRAYAPIRDQAPVREIRKAVAHGD